MEYLDLTIAKESRRTESALCAISGKTFHKEAVLTALLPKKPAAQSEGSINVEQKVGEKPIVRPTLKDQKNRDRNIYFSDKKISDENTDAT